MLRIHRSSLWRRAFRVCRVTPANAWTHRPVRYGYATVARQRIVGRPASGHRSRGPQATGEHVASGPRPPDPAAKGVHRDAPLARRNAPDVPPRGYTTRTLRSHLRTSVTRRHGARQNRGSRSEAAAPCHSPSRIRSVRRSTRRSSRRSALRRLASARCRYERRIGHPPSRWVRRWA